MSTKAAHQPAPSYGFAPQSTDGVMIEIQRLNRDHVLTRMGLHGHTFFELIYFERGGGTHALGGVRSPVEQGSLFVICPGELHDCSKIGRAEGWVMLFTRSALEQSPESLAFSQQWLPRHPLFDPFLSLTIRSRNPLRIANQDWPRWSQRLTSLDAELRNKPAHYRHASRALLHLILVDLARLLEPAELAIDDQPLLQSVFAFIEARFRKPISLADVARALGRNPAYITTNVRRRTGLTVGDWIQQRHVPHEAAWLMPGCCCRLVRAAIWRTYRWRAATTIPAIFCAHSRKCMEPPRRNGAPTSMPTSPKTKNPPSWAKYRLLDGSWIPAKLESDGRSQCTFPPGFLDNMADTMSGLRKLQREGKHILPTHDPDVFSKYPNGVA